MYKASLFFQDLVPKCGLSQHLLFIRRAVKVSDVASALTRLSLTQSLCLPSAPSDWLTTVWMSNTNRSGEPWHDMCACVCVFVHVCGREWRHGKRECDSSWETEKEDEEQKIRGKKKRANEKATFSVAPWLTLRRRLWLRLAHHHCNSSPRVADPLVLSSTWSLLHKKAFVGVKVLGSVFWTCGTNRAPTWQQPSL